MSIPEQTAKALADQVADLQKQLRDREVADVTARSEALRKTQESAAALQAAQAKAAHEVELEATRASSWHMHMLAIAPPNQPVDVGALLASVPKFGWSPGD